MTKGKASRRWRNKLKRQVEAYRSRAGAPVRATHKPTKVEAPKRKFLPQTDWHRRMFGYEED